MRSSEWRGPARVPGVLALFLLTACGGAQSTPEGSVTSFLDALESRDTAAFKESFTDSTRALVAEIERLSRQVAGGSGEALTLEEWCRAFCGGTVEGTTLAGESATVEVRLGEIQEEIPLVRLGDRWKIDLSARLMPAVQMLRLAAATSERGPGTVFPDSASRAGDTLP